MSRSCSSSIPSSELDTVPVTTIFICALRISVSVLSAIVMRIKASRKPSPAPLAVDRESMANANASIFFPMLCIMGMFMGYISACKLTNLSAKGCGLIGFLASNGSLNFQGRGGKRVGGSSPQRQDMKLPLYAYFKKSI